MKKFILIFLLISVSILACGCDPGAYHFDNKSLTERVKSVELIDYENFNPIEIDVTDDTELIFESDKMKILEVLDEEKIEEFLKDLSVITFHLENKSAKSPVGRGILLIFSDGGYIVISSTKVGRRSYSFVAEFDKNNIFIQHIAYVCDRPSLEKLMIKYFTCCKYSDF